MYMYGLEFRIEAVLQYAYSMVSWIPLFTRIYWRKIFFLLWKINSQMAIAYIR